MCLGLMNAIVFTCLFCPEGPKKGKHRKKNMKTIWGQQVDTHRAATAQANTNQAKLH